MAEKWKKIRKFPKYECSTLGRVRHIRNGNILNPYVCSQGYYITSLCTNDNPVKQIKVRIHTLIATTFLSKNDKNQVNHKDGNKLNNRLNNLEWTTPLENVRHGVKLGLHPKGSKNGHSKLSEFDVMNIRRLGQFCKGVHLSELYGVSPQTVCDILKGRTWK